MPSKEHDDVVALLRSLRADRIGEPETIEGARERGDATGDLFAVPAGVEIEPFDVDGPTRKSTSRTT